jgi:transposase
MVMIGIDPHKQTHTAVAIDSREVVLGERLVRARSGQVRELVAWADQLDNDRTWAVESAGGLGYLLAQQLLAAGEHVVDISAVLAARVRLLGSGRSDKNDPNDARSVASAALRSSSLTTVRVEDHATILRMLARRHTQISWARNKAACRLHALVGEFVPGGISKNSLFHRRLGSSRRSNRSVRSRLNAIVSPVNSSTTSPAATPNAKPPRRGSGSRSRRRARPSPRCSGSGM